MFQAVMASKTKASKSNLHNDMVEKATAAMKASTTNCAYSLSQKWRTINRPINPRDKTWVVGWKTGPYLLILMSSGTTVLQHTV